MSNCSPTTCRTTPALRHPEVHRVDPPCGIRRGGSPVHELPARPAGQLLTPADAVRCQPVVTCLMKGDLCILGEPPRRDNHVDPGCHLPDRALLADPPHRETNFSHRDAQRSDRTAAP
jgi:hypothetical protein